MRNPNTLLTAAIATALTVGNVDLTLAQGGNQQGGYSSGPYYGGQGGGPRYGNYGSGGQMQDGQMGDGGYPGYPSYPSYDGSQRQGGGQQRDQQRGEVLDERSSIKNITSMKNEGIIENSIPGERGESHDGGSPMGSHSSAGVGATSTGGRGW